MLAQATLAHICGRMGRAHFYNGVNFTSDNWTLVRKLVIQSVIDHVEMVENELV